MSGSDNFEASLTEDGRYRLLVEAVVDYAIYMLDRNGVVISWNTGAERFKGYTAQEIIGTHFSKFYTADDRSAGLPGRALETAAREGKFENEGWRLRKDGSRFWAHVVIDPIRTHKGDLIGFAKITRDLTERKDAAEQLRRSEEQFRYLVQGVTDYAIYMLDPKGIVSNWNAGAQRIKGYSPEEIVGRHFECFYVPEDRAASIPAEALATAEQVGRYESEALRQRKDGSTFWAHVIIDRILDDAGDLIGYAKITRDVTERREAQHKLDKAREELVQSQKMEAIGRLTGGVAHDFNNLLMAIVGSLDLAKRRVSGDPKVSKFLDVAMLATQRGISLTKRMLAFARRQQLDPQAVHLPTLVDGMHEMLDRSLGPSVEIKVMPFAPDCCTAFVDPQQLELALLNLAVNARDAMPEGGTLTMSFRMEAQAAGQVLDEQFVVMTVSDDGDGMDAETLARAAEPFFTTKGVGKGTGLGLSMVQGMIEQSGGKLILKSKKGIGTTVEVWLPAATSTSPVESTRNVGEHEGNCVRSTVLAVDDDSLVLMNTVAMLEELGHVVYSATSGKNALELMEQHADIELVITDQAMPRMTGLQLTGAIAKLRPGLPVIIATGYAELPGGSPTGIVILNKPFGLEQLDLSLSKALSVEPNGSG